MTLSLSPSLAEGCGGKLALRSVRHIVPQNRDRHEESPLALWEGKVTHSITICPGFPLFHKHGLGTYHKPRTSSAHEHLSVCIGYAQHDIWREDQQLVPGNPEDLCARDWYMIPWLISLNQGEFGWEPSFL